jgi:hypothetical protein
MSGLLPYAFLDVMSGAVPYIAFPDVAPQRRLPVQDGRRSTITPRAETESTTTTRASLSIDVADHAV